MSKRITQSAILKPLSYLLIEHERLKWFNFTLPGLLTIGFVAVFIFLSPHVNILGEGGLVESINGSIGFLIGFYIAALAAVATFENKNLDKKIAGEPAKLTYYQAEKFWQEELTRRKFLSFLFGYCSFMSIVLFVAGVFAQIFHTGFKILIPLQFHMPLTALFIASYMFIFFNLAITTFLGLFYLTDRLHRE